MYKRMSVFQYQSKYAKMMGIQATHEMHADIDYRDLYLAFLNRNKNYLDDLGNDGAHLILVTQENCSCINRCPYYTELQKRMYIQKWCFMSYIDDTERMEWLNYEAAKIRNENKPVDDKENKFNTTYFVTINFNHTSSLKNQLLAINNVLANKKVNNSSFAVYERFRENGILHPHAHFKLVLNQYDRPSKVCEFVFATAGVKKVCEKRNFVDYEKYVPLRHDKYLDGDKRDSKLEDVERDKKFRSENDIPDKILLS